MTWTYGWTSLHVRGFVSRQMDTSHSVKGARQLSQYILGKQTRMPVPYVADWEANNSNGIFSEMRWSIILRGYRTLFGRKLLPFNTHCPPETFLSEVVRVDEKCPSIERPMTAQNSGQSHRWKCAVTILCLCTYNVMYQIFCLPWISDKFWSCVNEYFTLKNEDVRSPLSLPPCDVVLLTDPCHGAGM